MTFSLNITRSNKQTSSHTIGSWALNFKHMHGWIVHSKIITCI